MPSRRFEAGEVERFQEIVDSLDRGKREYRFVVDTGGKRQYIERNPGLSGLVIREGVDSLALREGEKIEGGGEAEGKGRKRAGRRRGGGSKLDNGEVIPAM